MWIALRSRLILLVILVTCFVPTFLLSAGWALLSIVIDGNSPRAWKIAIGYDQLANATFGGNPDETISSRAGRARLAGERWGCVLCGFLDRLDPRHCDKNIGV